MKKLTPIQKLTEAKGLIVKHISADLDHLTISFHGDKYVSFGSDGGDLFRRIVSWAPNSKANINQINILLDHGVIDKLEYTNLIKQKEQEEINEMQTTLESEQYHARRTLRDLITNYPDIANQLIDERKERVANLSKTAKL